MTEHTGDAATIWSEVKELLRPKEGEFPNSRAGNLNFDPAVIRYQPAKRCIYCGTASLPEGLARFGDEHIFPFGLGGKVVLPEASCKICERLINKQIESIILLNQYGDHRAKNGLPTRKPRNRRHTKTVKSVFGATFEVPLKDHPAPMPIYDFGTAGLLGNRSEALDSVSRIGWDLTITSNDDAETLMREKYPQWDKKHRIHLLPFEFARFVAKIAHGATVAELGYGSFTPHLPPIILGNQSSPLRYIGGNLDGYDNRATTANCWVPYLQYNHHSETFGLVIDILIFADEGFPTYHALVGTVDTKNVEHMISLRQHLLNGKIV